MKLLSSLILACILSVSSSNALQSLKNEQYVMGKFADTKNDNQVAMVQPHLRLLSTSETEFMWADPEELMNSNIKFIDVTDHLELGRNANRLKRRTDAQFPLPKSMRMQVQVENIIAKIDTNRMSRRLRKFTSFMNRHYKSEYGVESSKWLLRKLTEIANKSPISDKISISEFKHSWSQPSIIVRIEGKREGDGQPIVIIGSHQDTVRGSFFGDGRAPGADDDGSGSITTMEAFTLLCEEGFEPEFPVEFHWYSAEEAGLLGSQDVADLYKRQRRNVMGMMQFDLTGYGKNGVYGIVTDYTDPGLTKFLRSLASTYGGIPAIDTKCNYGCSDHASWNKAGFRSAFPIEGEFRDSSPYIHKKTDTVENIDIDHMKEFVKLAVGFAVELSTASSKK